MGMWGTFKRLVGIGKDQSDGLKNESDGLIDNVSYISKGELDQLARRDEVGQERSDGLIDNVSYISSSELDRLALKGEMGVQGGPGDVGRADGGNITTPTSSRKDSGYLSMAGGNIDATNAKGVTSANDYEVMGSADLQNLGNKKDGLQNNLSDTYMKPKGAAREAVHTYVNTDETGKKPHYSDRKLPPIPQQAGHDTRSTDNKSLESVNKQDTKKVHTYVNTDETGKKPHYSDRKLPPIPQQAGHDTRSTDNKSLESVNKQDTKKVHTYVNTDETGKKPYYSDRKLPPIPQQAGHEARSTDNKSLEGVKRQGTKRVHSNEHAAIGGGDDAYAMINEVGKKPRYSDRNLPPIPQQAGHEARSTDNKSLESVNKQDTKKVHTYVNTDETGKKPYYSDRKLPPIPQQAGHEARSTDNKSLEGVKRQGTKRVHSNEHAAIGGGDDAYAMINEVGKKPHYSDRSLPPIPGSVSEAKDGKSSTRGKEEDIGALRPESTPSVSNGQSKAGGRAY